MTAAEFRKALDELGLSQAEFGRRINSPRSTVYRWASGRRPVPSAVEALIAEILRNRKDSKS